MNYRRLGEIAPTPDDTAWYDVIGRFQNAVADFKAKYALLQAENIDAAKYPELAQQQLDLLKRGTEIKATISSITSAVDSAWQWLKETFGFSGLREVGQISGLGIAPLIPIAVVVSAVALMAKWGLDFATHYQKVQMARDLLNQGYSPTQVNELVKSSSNSAPFFDFGNMGTVAMVGIGGFLAYKAIQAWKGDN